MVQFVWAPKLAVGDGPIWRKVIDALRADMSRGVVTPGTRLPPQRELAYRLRLGVGTISRAYVEAERMGLVTGHVGRGTFVASQVPPPGRQFSGPIDLARNLPPIGPALAHLSSSLEALRRRSDLAALADYSPTAGLDTVRGAGASWLNQQCGLTRATADRLIQTNGGQHALMLACSAFASAGDSILCDEATYPGYRTLAEYGRWTLSGVAADGRGMDPEELDRAAAETGARLLLLIPTLHNPTARTLDAERRREIVTVARARDLTIVEDDVYRVFGRTDDPAPFAELAPERTIHATSLSKALAPGLRLGFILPPENEPVRDRLYLAAQASGYCPPAAGGLMFTQWMEDGLAIRILDDVRGEVTARNELARRILGSAMAEPDSSHSLHLWLPMGPERANRVATAALQGGVEVTPPAAPFVDPAVVSGLRLCLGAAPDRQQLEHALLVVKSGLDDENQTKVRAIV